MTETRSAKKNRKRKLRELKGELEELRLQYLGAEKRGDTDEIEELR